jgi:hypothetical protein
MVTTYAVSEDLWLSRWLPYPRTAGPDDKRTRMIDTPQITQGPAKLTATIHLIIPRSKIRLIMGPGISELMATAVVKAQGIRLAGPWFTHVVLTAPLSLWPPALAGELSAIKGRAHGLPRPVRGPRRVRANSTPGSRRTVMTRVGTSMNAISRGGSRGPTRPTGPRD